MRFYTTTLSSGTFTVSASDGAIMISIQANASSGCTILGGTTFKGQQSSAFTLSDGQGLTLTAENGSNPLDGLTITRTSGTIDIVVGI
jgi:hypothetical protein